MRELLLPAGLLEEIPRIMVRKILLRGGRRNISLTKYQGEEGLDFRKRNIGGNMARDKDHLLVLFSVISVTSKN